MSWGVRACNKSFGPYPPSWGTQNSAKDSWQIGRKIESLIRWLCDEAENKQRKIDGSHISYSTGRTRKFRNSTLAKSPSINSAMPPMFLYINAAVAKEDTLRNDAVADWTAGQVLTSRRMSQILLHHLVYHYCIFKSLSYSFVPVHENSVLLRMPARSTLAQILGARWR